MRSAFSCRIMPTGLRSFIVPPSPHPGFPGHTTRRYPEKPGPFEAPGASSSPTRSANDRAGVHVAGQQHVRSDRREWCQRSRKEALPRSRGP
jgi:hypothetical protein